MARASRGCQHFASAISFGSKPAFVLVWLLSFYVTIGLVETPLVVVKDGLSRREMVRKSAFAGAVAAITPMVMSIAAPSAALAKSGIQSGCGCGRIWEGAMPSTMLPTR